MNKINVWNNVIKLDWHINLNFQSQIIHHLQWHSNWQCTFLNKIWISFLFLYLGQLSVLDSAKPCLSMFVKSDKRAWQSSSSSHLALLQLIACLASSLQTLCQAIYFKAFTLLYMQGCLIKLFRVGCFFDLSSYQGYHFELGLELF